MRSTKTAIGAVALGTIALMLAGCSSSGSTTASSVANFSSKAKATLTTYGIIGVKTWIYKGEVFDFSQVGQEKQDDTPSRTVSVMTSSCVGPNTKSRSCRSLMRRSSLP